MIVGEEGVGVAKAAAREVGIGEEMIYVIGEGKEGLKSAEELRGSDEFKAIEIRAEDRGTKVACELLRVGIEVLLIKETDLPYSSGTTYALTSVPLQNDSLILDASQGSCEGSSHQSCVRRVTSVAADQAHTLSQ